MKEKRCKSGMAYICILIVLIFYVSACAVTADGRFNETIHAVGRDDWSSVETASKEPLEKVRVTAGIESSKTISVKTNTAQGIEVYSGNGSTVDASDKSQGYLMVKHEGSIKRLKVQIICGDMSYSYDLNNAGGYEAFPVNMGDGTYTVRVAEQTTGTTYAVLYQTSIAIQLVDANMPYLYPNQRVKYSGDSNAVKISFDLCGNLMNEEEKVKAIYDYVKENITYDYNKAATVQNQSGYIPDADFTLASKAGICYDYSVLMAVMLRAQNIPTQVVVGSAANAPVHAWNKIYYNGNWQLYDATFAAGGATGSNYTESKRY